MIKIIKESKRDLFDPNLSKEEMEKINNSLDVSKIIENLQNVEDILKDMYLDDDVKYIDIEYFFFNLGVGLKEDFESIFKEENKIKYISAFFEGLNA